MERDEISSYLAALEREDCYRVDAVLKESPHEVTQRISFIGANGAEQGPYIRKLISRESGMGGAYERIFSAQQSGKRFKHIPIIHECYYDENHLVVVMEFVRGETLHDLVYRRDPSPQLAAEVFPLTCDAVTELHESFEPPLIHRDLKPSNVMVEDGNLTIIDFGIARAFKEGAEADTMRFGTRAFAPPEQFGFGQTTVQSDVYALGMLLYYCLTEEIPTSSVRDSKFQVEGVPSSLQPILERATALDPAARYGSAAELKAAFLAAMPPNAVGESDGSPVREQAGERSDKAVPVREGSRPRAKTLAIVVGAIALLAILAFVLSGVFHQGQGAGDVSTSQSAEQTSAAAGGTGASGGDAAGAQASTSSREGSQASLSSNSGGNAVPDAAGGPGSGQSAVVSDMRNGAPLRDDFNPETNFPVTIAGVTFHIPSCFKARVSQGDSGVTYYYAESGSTLAMIMAGETAIDAGGKTSAEESASGSVDGEGASDTKTVMDDFLAGLMKSDPVFKQLVAFTDYDLAGRPARIATFRGAVKDLPETTKGLYFYDRETGEMGMLFFGQTDNAQFDYSEDFATPLASATA